MVGDYGKLWLRHFGCTLDPEQERFFYWVLETLTNFSQESSMIVRVYDSAAGSTTYVKFSHDKEMHTVSAAEAKAHPDAFEAFGQASGTFS